MEVLLLVILLSAISSLTLMEVVDKFVPNSRCKGFFLKPQENHHGITPTVFKDAQYKQICQLWKEKYRFATLYDTDRRIPVYSAYTFTRKKESVNVSLSENKKYEWKNEPQLEGINRPDMELISEDKMDEFFHQAVNRDYTRSNYTRGHVFPCQYAADEVQQESTYTFTNVAPQRRLNNNMWAEQVETPMKTEIETKCVANEKNPAYIVTGVVPGKNSISIKRKGKKDKFETIEEVNIPSYFWTAFCCFNKRNKLISKAYLAEQNERNDKTYELRKMSVQRLNEHLTTLYENDFSIYGKFCLP